MDPDWLLVPSLPVRLPVTVHPEAALWDQVAGCLISRAGDPDEDQELWVWAASALVLTDIERKQACEKQFSVRFNLTAFKIRINKLFVFQIR